MSNKKWFIIGFFLLSFTSVSAQEVCSLSGYTVLTINGIFTNNIEAKENKESLKNFLPTTYKNEKVTVDYIYNSTHLAGFGDLVDVVNQGFFNSKSDFDLVEMLDDASEKVKTQKLLIVGHSQGNFYANNFYDKVADKSGGVPVQSIGVYGVATPADRVAGGGKYLTSDTDNVIATLVGSVKNIMKPNTHIELQDKKDNGHSFANVYMRYKGDKIVSDIKSSLDNLSSNQIQLTQSPCISPQKVSISRSINNAIVGTADFVVNSTIKVGSFIVTSVANTVKSIAGLFTNKNLAQVGSFDEQGQVSQSESVLSTENIPVVNIDNTSAKKEEQISSETIIENKKEDNIAEVPQVLSDSEISTTISDNSAIIDSENSSSGGGGHNSSGGGSSSVVLEPVSDTVAPIITLIGESTITINIGTNYVDAGATALDEKDGVVAVISSGVIDSSLLGTYVITYTSSDIAGNIATLTRTVNVIENTPSVPTDESSTTNLDTTPPVITLIGESTITINIGTTYVDAGATALDEKDGIIDVVTSGVVDTLNIGTYTITYTATDTDGNLATKNRIVNVINSNPVVSVVARLSLPNVGDFAGDGISTNRGRKNLTPFLFHVIYEDENNNPPQNIKLHIKNVTTGILLPDIVMNHILQGSEILSDGSFSNGELYTYTSEFDLGEYSYYFTASDKNGNTAEIGKDNSNLRFSSIASSYTYIPNSSFGINNGDGKDWQVWSFNGSNVYDWTDTYVNNYLREQFKIQSYTGGSWCSRCLQRGVFNHDPQKGFEASDVVISFLESNPQNSMNGKTYEFVIQWDSTGYTYTLYQGSSIEATGHTDVIDMNNNLWVGWDSSYNNFKIFPSGNWQGVVYASPMERTGGSDMVLQPYPVYNSDPNFNSAPVSNPEPETTPTPVLSSSKNITSFNFEGLDPKVVGLINNTNNTISLTVPYGTALTSIVPSVLISEKASVLPESNLIQDFTNPVIYTVKAEDGSTLVYTVSVIISSNPNIEPEPEPTPDPTPVPDHSSPVIESYTFNGMQNNITTDPLVNNISIFLNANKNVNWLTIKIEKNDDDSIYKTFQSGVGCVDGSNNCTKIWDGLLSRGGLLQSGTYRVKIHIKDEFDQEFEDYLPSVIIVNTP